MVRQKDLWSVTAFRNLYLAKRLTTGQIANRLGCSDEAVRQQLIRYGIERRHPRFENGKANPAYTDGQSVGGYRRVGYHPWNKGKSKETDLKVRAVADKIRRTFRVNGLGWKPWRTRHDAVNGLQRVADSLRFRERHKYKTILKDLGPGWTTEFFNGSFVFQKPNGAWSGIIVDIANPALKKIVEVDGKDHKEPKQAIPDKWRDRFLRRLGWTVRRIKTYQGGKNHHARRECHHRADREAASQGRD